MCGVVYLARRSSSGETVVVKVYGEWRQQLERDSMLARLNHPNILRVFEIGEFQGQPFCASEYVEEDLAKRLRQGPLSRSHAIRLIPAIALALQYAWDQGMVPPDFRPYDVLLAAESVPKLFDFEPIEAVKASPLGRPEFMAPEEIRNRATGVATLVYRVGAVMYAVLTGRSPFGKADGVIETLVRVLKEAPLPLRRANPAVGGDLEGVCLKCLEKAPENRYASLQELAEQVAALEPARD
jgi:serine/threonine-protein kinase